MTDWRPIETAPRDKTPILAFFPAYSTLKGNKPARQVVIWSTARGRWRYADDGSMSSLYPPTHWKPLQEPPDA